MAVLRKTVTGFLVIALLLASGVPGPAAAILLHRHAHHHAMPTPMLVEAASICPDAGMPSGDRQRPPDTPCCFAGVCSMMSAWLPAPPAVPAYLAVAALNYPAWTVQPTTGLKTPPAIRPPASAV